MATSTASAILCPACNGRSREAQIGAARLYECRKCSAIFGRCYLGDSYSVALPGLYAETPGAQTRYFDLECLGSAGVQRRHGWAEVDSKRVIQVG